MSFLELVTQRFSLRDFSSREIENEKLEYILQAGRMAPSAVNYQPWVFVVVKQKDAIQKLQECYPRDWFRKAHTCIIILGDHNQSWKRRDGKDHCDIDVAIAIDHMTLATVEQGLGCCWVCNFDVEKCRQLFNFASHLEPVAILPIAYPAENAVIPDKKRKASEEIIKWIE